MQDENHVHKLGTEDEPATEADVKNLVDDIRRENIRCPTDRQMLDWLQKQTKGYGNGWICRNSFTGRGMRLHETNLEGTKPTVREAIVDAMNQENENAG